MTAGSPPDPQLAAALAARKLRVEWRCEPPAGLDRDAVLRVAWDVVRRRRPELPGSCQDESLTIERVTGGDGGWTLVFAYTFDADFCSQYDRTESARAEVEVGGEAPRARWQPA